MFEGEKKGLLNVILTPVMYNNWWPIIFKNVRKSDVSELTHRIYFSVVNLITVDSLPMVKADWVLVVSYNVLLLKRI